MASQEILAQIEELKKVNPTNCKNGLADNAAFELTRAACRNLMYKQIESQALNELSNPGDTAGTTRAKTSSSGGIGVAGIAVISLVGIGMLVGVGYWAFLAD